MRHKPSWIVIYTIVIVALTGIAGVPADQYGDAKGGTPGNKFLYAGYTGERPPVEYGAVPEPIYVNDLDYAKRSDLGFPRIHTIIESYEDTIKRYASRYGFDWRLILAVMNQESRFRTQAVSHRGASGLMQLMPLTGEEVSSVLGIDSVDLPEDNIAGGVYYLWRVYTMFGEDTTDDRDREFDRIRLALAAYNGGPTRVRDAQQLARYLGLDADRWDIIRDLMPMLSRRFASLHRFVWEEGRPRGGYFEGWPETVNYVDRTIEYYAYYRQLFH
jgi:membrane-bound lytic murein transglycosylase F